MLSKRPIKLVRADRGEVGGAGQRGEFLLDAPVRRQPVVSARLDHGPGVRIQVERLVCILERLDVGMEAVVQQAREHPGQAAEWLTFGGGQLVGAHRDDISLTKRDEMLTAHGSGLSCVRTAKTPTLRVLAPGTVSAARRCAQVCPVSLTTMQML